MKTAFIVQFIKFSLVGLSNTAISYTIYAALVFFNIHYIAANGIAFTISVLNSFFWNSKFVFKLEGGTAKKLQALAKTFLSYAFSGLLLNTALLFLLIDMFMISKYIAPLCSLIITVPLNFILNKYWAFKQQKTCSPIVEE